MEGVGRPHSLLTMQTHHEEILEVVDSTVPLVLYTSFASGSGVEHVELAELLGWADIVEANTAIVLVVAADVALDIDHLDHY